MKGIKDRKVFRARMNRIFVFLGLLTALMGYASPPSSFREAKKEVAKLFFNHPITLYCGCHYDRFKQVDLKACGMAEASVFKRAKRIEIEHMMPAENFGRQLRCWREPICNGKGKKYRGRKCCRKTSQEFRHMEAELYNLWPTVGLVNQARSNYRFSAWAKREWFYGCDFKIDKALRKVEPATRAKGIVARANLFMADKYNLSLSKGQRKLFLAWNKQYPPSDWEKTWARRVEKIEGYKNSYIS